jgi:uncharacterized protein (TIRG00374 family)
LKLKHLLHVAVAGAVLAAVILSLHPEELWRALKNVDLGLVLLAVLLNLPVMLLAPLRSWLVFRRLGHDVPGRVLIPTTIVGFVAGGLTPAASGELLRVAALRRGAGVPAPDSMVAVLYERGLSSYFLGVITIVLVGVTTLPRPWPGLVIAGGIVLALAPWAFSGLAASLAARAQNLGLPGLLRRLLAMVAQLRLLLSDAILLVQWSGVTGLMFAVIALQYWLLARSVGSGIGYGDAWIGLGVSTLAGIASLIPFGLGVLDGSLAATLDRLGLTLEQGGVVAILVRAAVTLPLIVAAFACYFYLQRLVPADVTATAPGMSDAAAVE